jgi:ankyrin repeat protein/predicted RNA-binding Zn-ribbon protein involved in translation (DUF1610 family)
MESLHNQVREWKESQKGRLPKIELPCRSCQGKVEVEFDPPRKCPHCGKQFLGRPSQKNRIYAALTILFCLGVGWLFLYSIQSGEWTPENPEAAEFISGLLKNQTLLFFIALAVVIPLAGVLLRILAISSFGVIAPTATREKWACYAYAVIEGIPVDRRLDTSAWLRTRSLFPPPGDPFFSGDEYVGNSSDRQSWQGLPDSMAALLRDLEWADCFNKCVKGDWGYFGGREQEFTEYAQDSPALIDFVKRISSTEAAYANDAKGAPLLKRINELTPETAPKLKQCLVLAICGALSAAVSEGDLEKVRELLIVRPADVSRRDVGDGRTPLHLASAMGRNDMVELLLASSAEPNAKDKEGKTPLMIVASKGRQTQVAQSLLDRGADVNYKDDGGQTPLHEAAWGNKDLVELLLARGAMVDAQDSRGRTPLYNAPKREVAELLLSKGADPNHRSESGESPLHGAAWLFTRDVAELLLANKANVNAQNTSGDTPLHKAVEYKCPETVRLLLASGADVNAINQKGLTPLQCLQPWSNPNPELVARAKEVIELLTKPGT